MIIVADFVIIVDQKFFVFDDSDFCDRMLKTDVKLES